MTATNVPPTAAATGASARTASALRRRIDEGMAVDATDGPWGLISAVVLNPRRHRLTHLVVQPHHRHDLARLIPVSAIDRCDDHVTLSITRAQILRADLVEETQLLPMASYPTTDDGWDVGVSRVVAQPYFGMASSSAYGEVPAVLPTYVTNVFDHIPHGSAEIRRTSDVRSSDDHHVGRVDGFVVNADETITHVVLEHGHLWGHREITIPIDQVDRVRSDLATLRVSRDEVGELPSVPFHRVH